MVGMKVKYLKIDIMKIYKYIYYRSYLQSKKVNGAPEIPVYGHLCFIQTSNLLSLINILLTITKLNVNYDIRIGALVGPVVFYLIDYYYFSTKGNGEIIIKNESYSLGKYSFLLDVFGFASYMLVGLTYYFYAEF